MAYIISRLLCVLICKAFFRIKVYGRENIPRAGGFILASNHTSYLDPIALGVGCPRRLNYLARHDLFCNPLFSRWLNGVGVFPVKRGSASPAAFKEAIRLLGQGNGLVIFPEGSRVIDNFSSQPQPGIGFLAAKTNVAVVPAFVAGTNKALPRGAKFIRMRRISVRFGKQIHVERRMPYQDIAQLIMQEIRHISCSVLN